MLQQGILKMRYQWRSTNLLRRPQPRFFHPPIHGTMGSSSTRNWRQLYPDLDPKVVNENIQSIASAQLDSVKKVVPWFFENMPGHYFLNVSESLRIQQLQAMAVLDHFQQDGASIKLEEVSGDSRQWSFVYAGPGSKLLEQELNLLLDRRHGEMLSHVRVYNSADKQISVVIFTFSLPSGSTADSCTGAIIHKTLDEIQEREDRSQTKPGETVSRADVEGIISTYVPEYLHRWATKQLKVYRDLYADANRGEQTVVDVTAVNGHSSWLTVATSNTSPAQALKGTVHYLHSRGFGIEQVVVDCVEVERALPLHSLGYIVMTRVSFAHDSALSEDAVALLARDTKRLKWVSDDVIDLGLVRFPFLGLERAEIIMALCALMHAPLNARNPEAFAHLGAILSALEYDPKFMRIASRIVDLLLVKFKPSVDRQLSGFAEASHADWVQLGWEIVALEQVGNEENDLHTLDAVEVLHQMLVVLHTSESSNMGNPNRGALSIAVSPTTMQAGIDTGELVTGSQTVFVYGRDFVGFHCRFVRDPVLCRGDYKVVTVANDPISVLTSSLFSVAWKGAHDSDLMSRDLPARGTHSVVLLGEPPAGSEVDEVRRGVFRSFMNAIFDLQLLSVDPKHLAANIPSYMLSSPANCDTADKNWVWRCLHQRAGIPPSAGRAGVEIPPRFHQLRQVCTGMRCESLVSYLSIAAKHILPLDPSHEEFTLKLFGDESALMSDENAKGTDMANSSIACDPYTLIPILFREFGSNCKVIALAIGSTFLSDSEGLDHEELLRVIRLNLPMSHYSLDCLSEGGNIQTDCDAMVSVVPVVADVCIPCSGSFDINERNWKSLMRHCSFSARSRLIVEGAPGILSPEAVTTLHRFSVCVISHAVFAKGAALARELVCLTPEFAVDVYGKDCNINSNGDCGDIVAAATRVLSQSQLDVLSTFVRENVKKAAKREAHLLFRELSKSWLAGPSLAEQPQLIDVVERVSSAITRLKAIVTAGLKNPDNAALLQVGMKLAWRQWYPAAAGSWSSDSCPLPSPVAYRHNLISATLAPLYIYREGLRAVEIIPDDELFESLCRYFQYYDRIRSVVHEFSGPKKGEVEVFGLGESAGAASHTEISEEEKKQLLVFLEKYGPGAAVELEEEGYR